MEILYIYSFLVMTLVSVFITALYAMYARYETIDSFFTRKRTITQEEVILIFCDSIILFGIFIFFSLPIQ